MENLNLMTDEELAIMYVDGDNKAFDLLLSRNQEKLFTYILFVVRDREMANDMFQETFFKVVSRLQQGKYIANGKFSAWLMRIAHNVIMDWYRQQRAQNIVDAPKENDANLVNAINFIDQTKTDEQPKEEKIVPTLSTEDQKSQQQRRLIKTLLWVGGISVVAIFGYVVYQVAMLVM